jgi:hypothetical protein
VLCCRKDASSSGLQEESNKQHVSVSYVHVQVEGDTPLHKACRGGDLRQVVQLIRAGADIEASDWVNLHATTEDFF